MAANTLVITTFLLIAVFADAGKRSWEDYYEELGSEEDDGRQARQPGSEGSSLSLVQVALTDAEQSRRSDSENKDAGSKHTSEQAASDAIAAAEEAATSVSNAASFVADIASETASKALSNASTRLAESSVRVAKAAEDAMSEASVRFFDASDRKASHLAGPSRLHSKQIRRHGPPQADRHSDAGATHLPAMQAKEGRPSVHHSWPSLLWSALHFVEELILRETFALRAAILIACLLAVKVLHHHHMNSVANPATLKKSSWSKAPLDQQQDELAAQTLAAGREFYSRELQPDRPDLHEPSAFHEDKDSRRVVMGGE